MKIRRLALAAAAFAAIALAPGCKTNDTTTAKARANRAANLAVTDVRPITTPQPATLQPIAPVQPVVSDTPPAITAAASPAPSTPNASAGGSSYTVQKGDTLSRIARNKYGSLSSVRKIKEANPGIDYNNIKVGQKLILP